MPEKPTYEELMQRVKALEEEMAWYRQAVENSPNQIFSIDKAGQIKTWNPACESALKYGKEIIGQHYATLFPQAKAFQRVETMTNRVLQGHVMKNVDLTFRGRDGSVWETVSRLYPVFDQQGGVTACIFASTDITGQKRVQEALRASEERFRDLAELLPEIVYEMDQDGLLTFVNRQAYKVTGYTKKEFEKGFNAVSLFVPEDRDRAIQNITKIVGAEETGVHEYLAQRKDGSCFPVIAHSTVIMRGGRPVGARGILFDITEQKRIQEAMEKREVALAAKTNELEEVNSALRILLRHRDRDRIDLEEKVLSNVKELVVPYVEKLKQVPLDAKYMTYLKIVESNLNDIVSPFARQLSSKYSSLTPTEIQVAHLIREGKTTKEIAELLNSSYRTIESHRHSIRSKLGLKNIKSNLRSHLSSL